MNCKECGQPLIEIDFNSQYYLYLCDNLACRLYREPQGTRAKEPEPPATNTNANRMLRPSYHAYLEQKKENYRLLRNLGISSTEAPNLTSNKQTRLVLEQNGHGQK